MSEGWVLDHLWINDNKFQLFYANREKFRSGIISPPGPRIQTIDVMRVKGLVDDQWFSLTPLGQEVRKLLESEHA